MAAQRKPSNQSGAPTGNSSKVVDPKQKSRTATKGTINKTIAQRSNKNQISTSKQKNIASAKQSNESPKNTKRNQAAPAIDKIVNTTKEQATGRSMLVSKDGRTIEIKDDVVYEVHPGSPETFVDDVITELKSIPKSAPPSGAFYTQVQLGDHSVVSNSYGDWAPDAQYRSALLGDFNYDKGKHITSSKVSSIGYIQKSAKNDEILFGNIGSFNPAWTFDPSKLENSPPNQNQTSNYAWNSTPVETGGGLSAIRGFGGGRFFFEGWQNNLFDTTLA